LLLIDTGFKSLKIGIKSQANRACFQSYGFLNYYARIANKSSGKVEGFIFDLACSNMKAKVQIKDDYLSFYK